MTIPPSKPLALATVAVLALAPLAGCSGDSDNTTNTTSVQVSTPGPAASLPADAKFKGNKKVGAAADVKVTECNTDAGDQTATVELTNSSKAARDYSIQVIWLKNDDGTPLGATMIKRKAAAPGKKITLAGKAKVVAKADRCVLQVYAGTLA